MSMPRTLFATCLALSCCALTPAAGQEAPWLDVSIRTFSQAAPVDTVPSAGSPGAITPEVQLAEQRYLPMYLRYRLEASGRFGAVRVLPVPDNGAQLLIEGEILVSDGATLQLHLRAFDSTGRVWLDRDYGGSAVPGVSVTGDPLATDDFAWLFTEVLRDLLAVLDGLGATELERIHTVALLRYGQGLAPQSFDRYLRTTEDGALDIVSLPAANDPLLGRIEQIREHEYLFIDVVDQEYQRFFGDIKPVYDMWRRFQREQLESAASYVARETGTPSNYAPGSYYALQESYNNYRWAKVRELYLDELGEGFANEVEPTEVELENSLYRLTGTLEQQYREWRAILAELYQLDQQ